MDKYELRFQVCCTAGGGRIHLEHLQFRNKWAGVKEGETEGETMKSSAAHLYIISASTVTIRDCLFPGGEEGTGGILVAEEAFYQSLLDLECQNPELRGSSGGVEGGNLRLLIDFCIFSQIRLNAAVHSNNQAVAVLSNCEVRECGGAGVRAEEGSTLNLLNCQVVPCPGLRQVWRWCPGAGVRAGVRHRGHRLHRQPPGLPPHPQWTGW